MARIQHAVSRQREPGSGLRVAAPWVAALRVAAPWVAAPWVVALNVLGCVGEADLAEKLSGTGSGGPSGGTGATTGGTGARGEQDGSLTAVSGGGRESQATETTSGAHAMTAAGGYGGNPTAPNAELGGAEAVGAVGGDGTKPAPTDAGGAKATSIDAGGARAIPMGGGGAKGAELIDAGTPTAIDAGAVAGGRAVDAGEGEGPSPQPVTISGPTTLAPGGVALLQLDAEELFELSSVSVAGTELAVSDGQHVQFVLARPELDNPPAASTALKSIDLSSIRQQAFSLEQRSLSALPKEVQPLLRVAVRVPSTASPGASEFLLQTASGASRRWPVQIIDDVGVFVPPAPAGIVWPALFQRDGVFPVGTQGPYDPLVDPIHPLAFPRPAESLGVKYDVRLQTLAGKMCTSAAPATGLITGAEQLQGGTNNPLVGEYDVASNFVRIFIDRTAMGGAQEEYRGGWVTGARDAFEDTGSRGQLAAPEPGVSFLALRALRTGLPLVINQVATAKLFQQECPSLQ